MKNDYSRKKKVFKEAFMQFPVKYTWKSQKCVFEIPFQVTQDPETKKWTFKTSTALKSMELTFKENEEFDETTPDGREVRAIVKREGDTFTSEQTAKKEGQKSTKVVREFTGDEVKQTMEVLGTDVVCVQVFKRK